MRFIRNLPPNLKIVGKEWDCRNINNWKWNSNRRLAAFWVQTRKNTFFSKRHFALRSVPSNQRPWGLKRHILCYQQILEIPASAQYLNSPWRVLLPQLRMLLTWTWKWMWVCDRALEVRASWTKLGHIKVRKCHNLGHGFFFF